MTRPFFLKPRSAEHALETNTVRKEHARIYWLAFASILVILIAPIWLVRHLPLVDYPHALGRGYIAAHYDEEPLFRQLYEKPLAIVPNMAFEVFAEWFGKRVSIEVLGRIFISAIVVLFAVGCHMVARVFARGPSWLALPLIFFVYSPHLKYGNINFLFGLALFLILFAVWRRNVFDHPWRSAFLLLIASPLLFLSHLATYAFEWGAMGMSLLVLIRQRKITIGNAALQLVPLLVPISLFQLFLTHGGAVGELAFNPPLMKLVEMLTLISTYRRAFDVFFAFSLFAIAIYALRKIARFEINWEAAAIGIGFFVLLLATPATIFTSQGADGRFLIPAFVFSIASLGFSISLRALRNALVLLIGVSAVRVGVIVMDWKGMSDWLEPQIAMLDKLPNGSRLYPIYLPGASQGLEGKLFPAFGIYPIVRHGGYHPVLFTIRSQHPVIGRDGGHLFYVLQNRSELSDARMLQIVDSNDYLWCYHVPKDVMDHFAAYTEISDTGNGATMLKIHHDLSSIGRQ